MSDIVVFVADVGTALPSHSKDAAESSIAPRHHRQSPDHSHRPSVTAVGTQINDKGLSRLARAERLSAVA